MFLLTLFSGKMEFSFKEKWRPSYSQWNSNCEGTMFCNGSKVFLVGFKALVPIHPCVIWFSPCRPEALASGPLPWEKVLARSLLEMGWLRSIGELMQVTEGDFILGRAVPGKACQQRLRHSFCTCLSQYSLPSLVGGAGCWRGDQAFGALLVMFSVAEHLALAHCSEELSSAKVRSMLSFENN